MSARTRGLRLTAVALGAVLLTAVAGPASATPARAAVAGPPRASLFCDMFPWLCPAPSQPPAQTPAPGPTPTTQAPGGAPANTPAPARSSAPATSTPAPGATTPAPGATGATPNAAPANGAAAGSVTQACDTAGAPTGRIPMGSTKAQQAADLIKQCQDAKAAAGAQGGGSQVAAVAPARAGVVASPVPTNITASSQTVNGFDYVGVVSLPTADGGSVRVLKFTADSVQIAGINESVTANGATLRITSGSTVTLSGNVELYVLEQTGDVFGLLPLTISPDSPPPLVLPYLVFTDVTSKIAYIKADRLTLSRASLVVS